MYGTKMPTMQKGKIMLTFIDWFAGIGGFRLGMEMAGHKCVGFCEYDKYAVKSYRAMHETEGEWYRDDIQTVKHSEIPYADVWCAGFPCQDISVAGKQAGLDGNRSSLYFQLIELVKGKEEKDKPRYIFLENVKNLLSVNNGWDFARVLVALDEVGYDAEWQLINSKNYGVPQNRERIFIVGHLRNGCGGKVFPVKSTHGEIADIQGQCVNTITARYHGAQATGSYVVESEQHAQEVKQIGNVMPTRTRDNPNQGRVYDINGIAPCLNKAEGGERQPMILCQDLKVISSKTRKSNAKPFANTLDHNCNQGVVDGVRIRRLTPKECFRLQGWPDEYFERARAVNSDSQLYKQAGNGVTVNVIYEIARRL